MSLALACDLRISVTTAKFVQAFVNVGLVPDAGGIGLLTRLVGAAKATELIMLGEPISAAEANRLGLLYKLVAPEDLDDAVNTLAQKLASLPALALARIKDMINVATYNDMEPIYASEITNQASLALSNDFKEGVSAFTENRHPFFTGS